MGFREKLQEINSRTKTEQSDIDFDEMVRQQKLQELKEKKLPLVGEVVFIDEANYPDLIIKPGQSFADALIEYKQRKKLKETVSDKVREMLDKEDEEARIEYSKFNYEMLPEKDRDFVLGKEQVIKNRTTMMVLENGRDLISVKERIGHGLFSKWVEHCFPWKIRTAEKMMNVVLNFKYAETAHLDSFHKEALYLLAASSTPESAREEAIEKVEQGETITHRDAKALIESHKRIEKLEAELKEALSKNAEFGNLELIQKLETELEQERNKPARELIREVEPSDYQQLKQERKQLQDQIKNLKEAQKKIDSALYLDDKIKLMEQELSMLDLKVKSAKAFEKLEGTITKFLYDVVTGIKDVFEDYQIPDNLKPRFQKFIVEFRNGADSIESYLGKGDLK
jgi:hypothetical protein